jgi:hypothetical protein
MGERKGSTVGEGKYGSQQWRPSPHPAGRGERLDKCCGRKSLIVLS